MSINIILFSYEVCMYIFFSTKYGEFSISFKQICSEAQYKV